MVLALATMVHSSGVSKASAGDPGNGQWQKFGQITKVNLYTAQPQAGGAGPKTTPIVYQEEKDKATPAPKPVERGNSP